jgi:diguanylate cyclase (GGDEF)-like protein
MQSKSRRLRRWQFSVGVIVPAALLLVLTAAAAAAFIVWSASGIDERAKQRETTLVARAIERKIDDIPRVQESVALWDDAVTFSRVTPDKAWLDNNLGVWLNTYYDYEATAVLSDTDAPVYTSVGTRSPSPQFFETARAFIAPLVAEVRGKIARGALGDVADKGAPYPYALDIATIDGKAAVISVMPIATQTGAAPQPKGGEYLHVIVDYLDDGFADALDDDYGFDGGHFTTAAMSDGRHAAYPMLDRNGRLATFFEWRPNLPGIELLNQTGPVMAIAFIVAAILVLALVRRLWRSSSALEGERVAAKHQATHDPLTGLPNRAQFDVQLARDLGEKRSRLPIALLVLDLDRFKHINDTLGHAAGDDLICAVGQRLAELIGPADILARLGGDEFAIIHLCRDGAANALKLANSIVEAIAKPFGVSGGEAFVGASVGLAVADRDDRDPQELMRKADIALYEAKARGRSRAIVYEEAMNAQLQDRHMIEGELREALKVTSQLSVAFQPLFSGRTGEIVGAEALVRWNHPKLGAIAPARFVPIAENAGLIEPLGEFVLRRACEFSARWPGRRIAVNISPAQLLNPHFPERVFDLLVDTAMRPSDLELEITEGILLDNQSAAVEAINTFRKAGIRIALDDFGTGYSSLNYLKRYPVDCIKIDRSFVAQLTPKNSSVAIVQAMVTLAHALGIEVTAEGVETHEQMTILKAMGCNMFQGFLLSPPAAEDVVEAKFRRAMERRQKTVAQIA